MLTPGVERKRWPIRDHPAEHWLKPAKRVRPSHISSCASTMAARLEVVAHGPQVVFPAAVHDWSRRATKCSRRAIRRKIRGALQSAPRQEVPGSFTVSITCSAHIPTEEMKKRRAGSRRTGRRRMATRSQTTSISRTGTDVAVQMNFEGAIGAFICGGTMARNETLLSHVPAGLALARMSCNRLYYGPRRRSGRGADSVMLHALYAAQTGGAARVGQRAKALRIFPKTGVGLTGGTERGRGAPGWRQDQRLANILGACLGAGRRTAVQLQRATNTLSLQYRRKSDGRSIGSGPNVVVMDKVQPPA